MPRFARGARGDAASTAARWRESTRAAHADYRGVAARRGRVPGACRCGTSCDWLDEHLPDDAILTNGAGNYATLAASLLSLPRLPHAARADLRRDGLRRAGGDRREDRCTRAHRSSAFSGDGCFLMNGQELATAVQYDAAVIFVVVEQRHVRHHPHAPGARVSGPRLRHRPRAIPISPRSRARSARTARRSRRPAQFAPAFERASPRASPR